MEIGQHRIDGFKRITGLDKQGGFSVERPQFTSRRCGLKATHYGGANRDNAPALLTCLVDGLDHRFCANLDAFGMHEMAVNIISAHWLESPGAYMQRNAGQT